MATRKKPDADHWIAKDTLKAEEKGLSLEQYRAEFLDEYDDETGEWPKTIRTVADLPDEFNEDGTKNPDHLRARVKLVTDLIVKSATGEAEMPRNFNIPAAKEILRDEIRLLGFDPDHLMDVRTDAEKAMDAAKTLLEAPDELFAQTDETLVAIEEAMNSADRHCRELIGAPGTARGAEIDQNALLYKSKRLALDAKKKIAVWQDRLARVKALRKRVREDVPEGKTDEREIIAYSAAGELRWTIYMMRPDKATANAATQFGVNVQANNALTYQVGVPHARMVICDYASENAWVRDMRIIDREDRQIGYIRDPEGPMEGTIHVMAPGHGKSARMHGKISRDIARNPRVRWLFLHAQEDVSVQNQNHVASFFDPDIAQGRRVLSFHPEIKVDRASDKGFRLLMPGGERQKSPTITAVGSRAKKSGIDADKIWLDDYVDQAATEQETERKRDFSRLNGTWLRRIRGRTGFHITTTTLWHHEDANSIRIAQIRRGRLRVALCIMPCGGPNSERPYSPIWPEQYPAKWLKATYIAMRDPRLYAAAFMCDPQPDEMRKVKGLGFYLREVPESGSPSIGWAVDQMAQHAKFLHNAVYYISIDPSATNEEKSDKASFIYAAVGDIVTERKTDMGMEIESRHVARILDARQFHAIQTECVEEVLEFATTNKVDYILCETRSGFRAMTEIFYARAGIDIISYDPKNRQKIQRLQDVAPMLDSRLMARGLPPPCIEFPGKIKDHVGGIIKMGPDDEFGWLATQILDAGMCSEDHALDCVTQFAKHIGPEMGVGFGAVTQQLHNMTRMSRAQTAAEKQLESYDMPAFKDSVAEEDLRFSQGWSN